VAIRWSFHCAARVGVAPWGGALSIHYGKSALDLLGSASWPEREDLSIELLKLLGAAQAGGSTIAECRVTASRIDPSDDHSWYREWKSIADVNRERGNAALREGHVLTAKSNWLRAVNYYRTAAFPFDRDDSHCRGAIDSMRQCARDYLQCCDPRGEVLLIPWPGGYPLEAYFLPAAETARPSPAIICMGEPGERKEEFLHKVARYASERGIALAVGVADCVPVFIAHPSGIVALVHSGWRGTAGRILERGVEVLKRAALVRSSRKLSVRDWPAARSRMKSRDTKGVRLNCTW